LGISGGDAAATSATAAFPRLGELEREHGSVIRGMLRARAKPGRLTGFGAAGMQQLIDRLAQRLHGNLQLGVAVEDLTPSASGWRVRAASGEFEADRVIVATPAGAAAGLIEAWDPVLAGRLRRIAYAPMRVAGVAFRAQDVPVPLDGFGFLVARDQGVRILGALYTSTIFPAQAPEGIAYLRVFLGGAADPEAAQLDADVIRAIVRDDLATTLGITAAPVAFHEVLWPDAIPQYAIGHARLVREIETDAGRHAGFALTGNAYRGLGLGDTVRNACMSAAAWIDSDADRSA
jgi:oxygen-dependent protoporphyrinogen oxidase